MVLVAEVGLGEVELVAVATSRERGVGGLDGEAVVAEHQEVVARRPLGLVDCHGVAERQVARLDVALGDVEAAAVVDLHGQVVAAGAEPVPRSPFSRSSR